MRQRSIAVALAAMLFAMPAFAQALLPGPQGDEVGKNHERILRIPSADPAVLMEATEFRPDGNGPFPLVVINHGSPAGAGERLIMRRQRYASSSAWFVSHGFAVVVPLRRGYGATGGPWKEDYGSCNGPDYFNTGLAAADDIEAAIAYMRQQPYVDGKRVIVLGQSAGGWGAMALSSRNPEGVLAFINFAGGRGGYQGGRPNSNCTPTRLFDAAEKYGKTARTPALWIYTENDGFFAPALSRNIHKAFVGAGGVAEYRLLPPFAEEGHNLFGATDGGVIWQPLVVSFLGGIRDLEFK